MAKSCEALWWSLFALGGVVVAFLFPITILITGIIVPAGLLGEQALYHVVHHPLTRLYLFVAISLPLFHAAHRLHLMLRDVGLRALSGPLGVLLYGAALVGTVLASVFLVQM
jgi:fumarate reductase subunit D